jgi:hypothetical protein
MMLRGDAAPYALHQSTFFENRIGVYIMRVVTRNDLELMTREFALRHVPAISLGTTSDGNQLVWEVPEAHETAIREMHAQDHVLWFRSEGPLVHNDEAVPVDEPQIDRELQHDLDNMSVRLNAMTDEPTCLAETLNGFTLPPHVLGQILMVHLAAVMQADHKAWKLDDKIFWDEGGRSHGA